jgi:hypothetical protein
MYLDLYLTQRMECLYKIHKKNCFLILSKLSLKMESRHNIMSLLANFSVFIIIDKGKAIY